MRRLSIAIALGFVGFLASSAGGAEACGCGEPRGPVVAHGVSPAGAPWLIRAQPVTSRGVLVNFDIAPGDGIDAGYSVGIDLPLRPTEFTIDLGPEDIDAYPEGDASGVTSRFIATLELGMSDGTTLDAQPQYAPAGLRRKFPGVRALRFFDVFYPAGVRPLTATALDAHGHVLARQVAHNGFFG